MIYLSATGIKDFLDCSKKFVWKKGKAEQEQTPDLIVGTLVHNLIESDWSKSKSETLTKFFLKAEEHNLQDRYINKGLTCINNFYESFKQLLYEDDTSETFFKYGLFDDVILVGRIDRIVNRNSLVLDWKTSTSDVKNIDNDIQFLLYYYAYSRMYNKPPALVTYVSLYHNRLINLNINKDYYNYLFSDVIPGVVAQIKANSFYRSGAFKGKCRNCLYRQQCLTEEQ